MNKKTIGIIGGGTMGRAVYQALSRTCGSDEIFVADTSKEKLSYVIQTNRYDDANTMIPCCDVLVLAVKPQSFHALMDGVAVSLEDKLIISINSDICLS